VGPLAAGAVVLVPFPFSDLSQSKLRPAVVLADVLRGDFILCQVTSRDYGDRVAIPLTEDAFLEGSLRRMSYARPGKLFTASRGLIVAQIGVLEPGALANLTGQVVRIVQLGRIP
jgi:mRNA interferase MazF